MLNQFVGVGRLVAEPSAKEMEDGKKVSNITIAVPRSYKNENGDYDTNCCRENNISIIIKRKK